jgi:NADPH:quinone reductase-like Zn-dependent oxidoreductase
MVATLNWVANSKLKPVIYRTFPLEKTPDAFDLLRNRSVVGKVLVKPS